MKNLDTPAKRLWFTMIPLGVAIFIATLFFNDYGIRVGCALMAVWKGYWYCSSYGGYSIPQFISYVGILLVISGLTFSFASKTVLNFYEATLGKVIRWVRHGSGAEIE